jgi:uncharacterized membrane protein
MHAICGWLMMRFMALRRRVSYPSVVTIVAIIYGVVLATIGMLRHHNFWSGALDMGIFDQGEWLLAHGHSHVSLLGRNLFGDHVSASYIILAPVYRVWPSVNVLIIVQAIALACSVHPHVRLARNSGFSERVALVIAISSSALFAAALFDFHASVLAVPFLCWALVALQERRSTLLMVMGIAIVLCRSDLLTCVLALMLLAPRAWRLRLAMIVAVGVCLSVLPPVFGARTVWGDHYRALGNSPVDALLHPWRLASVLFRVGTASSLLFWLAPLALTPLLSPKRMLALLIVGSPILLSTAPSLHQPWYHEGAVLEPFAFFAMIDPANRRWIPLPRLQFVALVMSLVTLAVMSPASTIAPPNNRLSNFVKMAPGADFEGLVQAIPPFVGVAAVDPVASHLSQRQFMYAWPSPFVDTHLLGPTNAASRSHVAYVVVKDDDEARARQFGFNNVVMRSGEYLVAKR